MTRVHAMLQGDTTFPQLDPKQWKETWSEKHAADERHAVAFTFVNYERIR